MANVYKKENIKWNVVEEDVFKETMHTVFEAVAKTISRTMGPFGTTTIIEEKGQIVTTKDGYNVLKRIRFDDSIANNILDILHDIVHKVVVTVGDGSTTSTVASHALLESITNSTILERIRRKDFFDELSYCANAIIDYIVRNAQTISPENLGEEIRRVAYISTNGDNHVSDIIADIYDKTGNPVIELLNSRTIDTHHEIIEGYQIKNTYLDGIYINNDDRCEYKNPMLLIFNHKLDYQEYYNKIIGPAMAYAMESGKQLIVMAPYYDNYSLDQIARQANAVVASGSKKFPVIYTNLSILNNMSKLELNDFACMCGCSVIKEDVVNHIEDKTFNLEDHIGEVETISVGPEFTLVTGFIKRNPAMYEILLQDAESKLKNELQLNIDSNTVSIASFECKRRLAKLQGVMSKIYIGGRSAMEKKTNHDAIEDAVKACESAYRYGINIGGSLIIPIAIKKLIEDENNTLIRREIFGLLDNAFRDVFKVVIRNKYNQEKDYELVEEIIENCVNNEMCYDLINDEYTDKIINPCYTDIEILKATTSIIGLLLSSNQYVSTRIE